MRENLLPKTPQMGGTPGFFFLLLFFRVFSFLKKFFQGLSLSLGFQDLKASRGLVSPPPRLLSGSHSFCY